MNVVRLKPADEFEQFWQAYPRKVGKKAARAEFAKALRDPDWPGIEAVLAALKAYRHGKPDYCDYCHPRTWLSQGRWDDEFETEGEVTRSAEEIRAEIAARRR